MDDEKLIALIRRYEELYNTHHKNYANHEKKDACWKHISKELGLSGKMNDGDLKTQKRFSTVRHLHTYLTFSV